MELNNVSELSNISKVINISGVTKSLNPLDSDFLANLPPELMSKITGLITILKVTGIAIIIYIIILIIKWFFNIRRNIRINKIYKKIEIIDKKLDLLLEKKKIKDLEKNKPKEKKEDSKKEEKKKGFFKIFKKKKK